MSAKRPFIVYTILAINLLLWVCLELTGGSKDTENLMRFGGISFLEIRSGEYWRLLAAMFLHIGASHLAVNSLSLLIMGGMVEKVFSHIRFSIIYIVSGLGGSAFSFLMIHPFSIGAGASGAVFGCVGALASFFLIHRQDLGQLGKQNLNAILILAAINFAFGFMMPGIDNWAHIGGFLAGIMVGIGLTPAHLTSTKLSINRVTTKEHILNHKTAKTLAFLVAIFTIVATVIVANNRNFIDRL